MTAEKVQQLNSQRSIYYNLQAQLVQAEIDKTAAQVARAKEDTFRARDYSHAPALACQNQVTDQPPMSFSRELYDQTGKNDSLTVISITDTHPGISRTYIRQIEANSFHPEKG